MTKLRCEHLFAVLFLMKIFWILSTDSALSSVTLGGAVLSAVLQAVLLVPIVLCADKPAVQSAKGYQLVCALFYLYLAARVLTRLISVLDGINIPVRSRTLALALLALVCLYGAVLGLRALSRVGILLLGMALLAFAVLLLGAMPSFTASQLVTAGTQGILSTAWQDFCDSGSFVVCAVLLSRLSSGSARAVYAALGAQLAAIAAVTILSVGVLGRLADVSDYPFFTLCAFSQPFSVQRSDALFLLLYTEIGAFSAAYPLALAVDALRGIFPNLRGTAWWLTGAMLLGVWALTAVQTELSAVSAAAWLILLTIIPCIRLLRGKEEREKC